jgi:hypothetical protein
LGSKHREEKAETWGTDNPTYPSKNVEDEETLGKCTEVRGNCPKRKPVLGDLEHGPGLQLIGIRCIWRFAFCVIKRVPISLELNTLLESVWLALEAPLDSVLRIKDELFGCS